MGEGTSEAAGRSDARRRGSDKDRRRYLAVVPPVVAQALIAVAKRQGQLGLILLLTKYYLRPEQAAGARLEDAGLVAAGFERPIPVADADRADIAKWLAKKRRAHSAQAVRDVLGRMRRDVVAELSSTVSATWPTAWDELVDLGVVSLRRFAAERHAVGCRYEEAAYRELLHDSEADPYEVLRYLSTPARQMIASAAQKLAFEIGRAITSEERQ